MEPMPTVALAIEICCQIANGNFWTNFDHGPSKKYPDQRVYICTVYAAASTSSPQIVPGNSSTIRQQEWKHSMRVGRRQVCVHAAAALRRLRPAQNVGPLLCWHPAQVLQVGSTTWFSVSVDLATGFEVCATYNELSVDGKR